jgi:hypothetical protein
MTIRQFLHGLLLLAVLYAIAGTTGDPDLWGHVRFGQDMLAERAVRLPDTYSFTTDRAWINHEWLSEVLFALAFGLGGPTGLNLLRILLITGLLAIVWRASAALVERRRMMVVGASALGIYMRAHPIRPQVFSLLLFAILLMLIKRAEDRQSLRPIFWTPALMAAWVNLHGGWIVGLGFFVLWCITISIAAPWRQRAAVAGTVAAALACTLLNPYGMAMWNFLAGTVRLGRPMIADWQPVYQLPPLLWISWITGFGVVVLTAMRARSRTDWMHVGMVAALGVAAMRVSRLDAFFSLAAIFLAIRLLTMAEVAGPVVAPRSRRSAAIATAFAVCAVGVSVALLPRMTRVPVPEHLMPDSEVARYVRDRKLNGHVLMWFDWGQYSIWHFGPDLKVSMDGRRETVYGERLLADHLRFYFGRADEWRYAESLNADYVWIPKHLPAAGALQRHGWSALCEGRSSILLTRDTAEPRCTHEDPRRHEEHEGPGRHGRTFPQL